LIGHLLSSGLDGEVFLGAGDFRLAGIAILGNQVTGETRDLEIRNFLNHSLPTNNGFARAQSDGPGRYPIAH